jgi:pimeloyl-ACP methyl ester carboxylesterase
MRRQFVDTKFGQMHVVEEGEGHPVLFLHQSPRSWNEHRFVLPIVGRRYRAIAMDTLGFGDSPKLTEDEHKIELFAEAAVATLDALGIERTHVVGHHTGGVVGIEIAASAPDRVDKLILSSVPLVTAKRRERGHTEVDDAEPREDGSHLVELWQGRQAFYPPGRSDLLKAFLLDALKVEDPVLGHKAVSWYHMEDRLPLIRAKAYVITGTGDEFSHPQAKPMSEALGGAPIVEVEGGMVPMPDQMPEEFAAAVLAILDGVENG